MGPEPTAAPLRYPAVVLATLAVVGAPVFADSALWMSGILTSILPLIAVGASSWLIASRATAAFWAARHRGGDTVVGELMIWGWLRRRRTELPLPSAVSLTETLNGSGTEPLVILTLQQREHLLREVVSALEVRDADTYGHSGRVARHATAIAKRMGLPREQVTKIRAAAAIHDVGKIVAPNSVLNKPGSLTEEEFALIKQHPVVGAKTVAALGDEELADIVRHHHERIDGKGYPDHLQGSEIPIGARIIAVADTFDAVTSRRPYHPARTHREALRLLSAEAGTQLDPEVVRVFRAYYAAVSGVPLRALLHHGPGHLPAPFYHGHGQPPASQQYQLDGMPIPADDGGSDGDRAARGPEPCADPGRSRDRQRL
ncbi:MAG: HD-GYP domain-containing protein [Solirubrobacterales bacterium]